MLPPGVRLVASCLDGVIVSLEPRVLKRRRHGYKLMQQPRSVLKAQLQNANSKT